MESFVHIRQVLWNLLLIKKKHHYNQTFHHQKKYFSYPFSALNINAQSQFIIHWTCIVVTSLVVDHQFFVDFIVHQTKCLLMSTICSTNITVYFTKCTKIDTNTNWWRLLLNVVVVKYRGLCHVVNVYEVKDYRILYSFKNVYIHLSPASVAGPRLHTAFLWPLRMSAQRHQHTSVRKTSIINRQCGTKIIYSPLL